MSEIPNKKILLGLSGGVDSAFAVHLLRKAGYSVTGIFLRMHEYADVCGAERAAQTAGIPFIVKDCSVDFKECVIADFYNEYKNGRTPNPCIICNRYVKFENLIRAADETDIPYIATGHYVRIKYDESINRYYPAPATDGRKDQSYVLWRLTQPQLSRFIAPLAGYEKTSVKEEAARLGISAAAKKESQEICFIPDNDYIGYIHTHWGESAKGNFIDRDGKILGVHNGIIRYTNGQRRGLGISFGEPYVVVGKNAADNTVTLDRAGTEYSDACIIDTLNFCYLTENELTDHTFWAKTRYSQRFTEAKVKLSGEICEIRFNEPVRSITPGQSCVLYTTDKDGDICVAFGGIIS